MVRTIHAVLILKSGTDITRGPNCASLYNNIDITLETYIILHFLKEFCTIKSRRRFQDKAYNVVRLNPENRRCSARRGSAGLTRIK